MLACSATGVLALYNGMSATMMGVAPYAGLKFMTYEGLKSALCSWRGVEEKDLPGVSLFQRRGQLIGQPGAARMHL